MPSTLNLRFVNQYERYKDNLLIHIIRYVSPVPVVIDGAEPPHLEIRGPFARKEKGLRDSLSRKLARHIKPASSRKSVTTLYHTAENTRYDSGDADYSISSDLGVERENHFRMPNWWGSIDWSNFGINHPNAPRTRNKINIERLLTPLGDAVLQKPRKMALFTTHLREPRGTLFRELSKVVQTDGYGKGFDPSITDHNESGIFKDDILQDYMFSLCPENSMYPGYYTEKVPESFAAGCIPVSWADQNIVVDFVEGSFINTADFAHLGYGAAFAREITPEKLKRLTSTPLLDKSPDFPALLGFVERVVERALR